MAKRRKAKTKVVTRYRAKPVKARSRRRGKTGFVSKLAKFALPIGVLGSFVPPYLSRSKDSGSSVYDLLLDDVKNFNAKDAMVRVKEHIPQVVAPIGASVLIRETRVLGKYSGVAADLAMGLGIGTAAKAVLDPPFVGAPVGMGAPVGGGSVVPIASVGKLVSLPHGSALGNPYEVVS